MQSLFFYIWRMIARWSINIFIFTFTLLGIVSQQQVNLPNQEIVLQFTDKEIESFEAQKTIADVKKQLEVLGVDNIQIHELKEGSIKITYYSDTDVASIKKILSEESHLNLGKANGSKEEQDTNSDSDKNPSGYDIDVYEIHKGNDAESNALGKCAFAPKSENNLCSNPNVYTLFNGLGIVDIVNTEDKTHKFSWNIAIAINNSSYKIPGVRAGPILRA